MSTTPQLLTDEQAAIAALTNIFTDRDTRIASLQQQLTDLTADDSSLAAKLLAAQQQIGAMQNIKVWDDLEMMPWLVGAGTVANTGTAGSTQTGAQTLPGVNSGSFSINPNGPWADRINYFKAGADPTRKAYEYKVGIYFADSAAASASQCIELDIKHVIPPLVFDPGLQLDFAEGLWRVWDRSSHTWRSTGTALKRLTPGQWLTFVLTAHRDDANIYYDSITANGQPIAISPDVATFAATNEPTQVAMLNPGFQLDGDKAAIPYTVYVRGMRFRAAVDVQYF